MSAEISRFTKQIDNVNQSMLSRKKFLKVRFDRFERRHRRGCEEWNRVHPLSGMWMHSPHVAQVFSDLYPVDSRVWGHTHNTYDRSESIESVLTSLISAKENASTAITRSVWLIDLTATARSRHRMTIAQCALNQS